MTIITFAKDAIHLIDEDVIHPMERVASSVSRSVIGAAETIYQTEKTVAGNYLKASENLSRAAVRATDSMANNANRLVTDSVNIIDDVGYGIKSITNNLPIIIIAGIGAFILLRR